MEWVEIIPPSDITIVARSHMSLKTGPYFLYNLNNGVQNQNYTTVQVTSYKFIKEHGYISNSRED
jgi:hypothetical protein